MKKYKVDFNTLTVINDHNCDHGLEVYRFLKSIGSDFHQYIPIVELMESDARIDEQGAQLIFPVKRENNKMTGFSVPDDGYGKFMTEVFDEWVKNDVGEIYVRLFETVLAQNLGYPPSICIFQKTCGNALVLEQNGDLYPCDHFVYEDLKLGNINDEYSIDMAKSDKQKAFGDSKETTLTDMCRSCEFLNLCNGGCPKHRVVEVGETYQQNHLCGSYKKIFSHVKPYMESVSYTHLINEGKDDNNNQIDEYLDEYKGPGVQHLAFLSSDILSSLDKMKGSNIETLDIDDDYYEEAFQRVKNVREDKQRIQKHQVLVDGDEDGYLLQIFTKNLFGPIFIEIIQRANHKGFGEGNFGALFKSIERDQERRGVI